jgi:hypothetical protein
MNYINVQFQSNNKVAFHGHDVTWFVVTVVVDVHDVVPGNASGTLGSSPFSPYQNARKRIHCSRDMETLCNQGMSSAHISSLFY